MLRHLLRRELCRRCRRRRLRRYHLYLVPAARQVAIELVSRQLRKVSSGRIHRSGSRADFQGNRPFIGCAYAPAVGHAWHLSLLLRFSSRRRRVQRRELVYLLILRLHRRLSFLGLVLLLSLLNRPDGARSVLTLLRAPPRRAICDVDTHHLDRGVQSKLVTHGVQIIDRRDELKILLQDLRRSLGWISICQQFWIVFLINLLHSFGILIIRMNSYW